MQVNLKTQPVYPNRTYSVSCPELDFRCGIRYVSLKLQSDHTKQLRSWSVGWATISKLSKPGSLPEHASLPGGFSLLLRLALAEDLYGVLIRGVPNNNALHKILTVSRYRQVRWTPYGEWFGTLRKRVGGQ